MNIAIIDIGWKQLYIDSLEKEALGGSESWLMQVSNEFSKYGKIDVYCSTDAEQTKGNLRFIPLYNIIDYFVQRPHYDFVILNRIVYRFGADFIGLIRQYNVTDNIFIQMHDLSMLYEDHLIREDELSRICIHDKRVRGFVFLTPWHAQNFYAQYPALQDIGYFVIPNGVDRTLFSKDKKKKDHRVLWSSCAERGLDILINDVYPLVKKEIKDFGVDVAGYNDLSGINVEDVDVKVLGNLDKKTLYKEMRKHCCWFYPGTFAETFCITMVENILNENIVVSPFTFGTQHILDEEIMKKIGMKNDFLNNKSMMYVEACKEAAAKIVDAIKNYDNYKDVVWQAKEHCFKYTWLNTAIGYINAYSAVTYKSYPVKKRLKGIFLAQSCNLEFFKKEEKLVRETWAKELLEGKHPGYEYFSYTACDEQHPEPCIDDHTIYVKNDDQLYSTYEKMRDTYRLLLEKGYDFDRIFRTNTSTFINVPKAIKLIEESHENDLISDVCGYYHLMPDQSLTFQFNTFTGNAYIMSKSIADRIFTSNYDSNINSVKDGDDIITAHIINEIFNDGEINYVDLNHEKDGSVCSCKRYKFTDMEGDSDDEHNQRYTEDPTVVKDYVTVSYRLNDIDVEKREEMGEFEHLKELYKEYIK